MNTGTRNLILGLAAFNVALLGLLLFRDRAITPAAAEAPSVAAELARTQPGTAPAAMDSLAPASDPTVQESAPVAVQALQVEAPAPVRFEEPAPATTAPTRTATDRQPAPAPRPRTQAPRPAPRTDAPREESRVASNDPRGVPLDNRQRPEPTREVQAPPPPRTLVVPAGRNLPVRLDVGLHSRQVRSGDQFEASLAEDLLIDGILLARAGSPVLGLVSDVVTAGRVEGRERLRLTISELTLLGRRTPIQASSLSLEAEDDKGRDAKVVGAAAAVGAMIGGLTKGGKGAATGAAAGAAAGTGAVLATRGRAIVLESGEQLDFTLTDSVRVELERRSPAGGEPAQEEPEEKDLDSLGVARR